MKDQLFLFSKHPTFLKSVHKHKSEKYVFSKLDLRWIDYVLIAGKHMRPEELDVLKGDSTKLRSKLGWEPKYTFETMLDEMIEYWLEYYKEKDIIYA